jgi:hypothetical protein
MYIFQNFFEKYAYNEENFFAPPSQNLALPLLTTVDVTVKMRKVNLHVCTYTATSCPY